MMRSNSFQIRPKLHIILNALLSLPGEESLCKFKKHYSTMGTWGTGLSSNDTYADIYDSFFELYNDGLNVDEISKKLIKENQEIIDDQDDANNFWFALAKAQWECKDLNREILEKVRHIIESGS